MCACLRVFVFGVYVSFCLWCIFVFVRMCSCARSGRVDVLCMPRLAHNTYSVCVGVGVWMFCARRAPMSCGCPVHVIVCARACISTCLVPMCT